MKKHYVFFYPYLFVLLWSLGFIFAKLGLGVAEPFTLLSLRYFFAFFLFVILFIIYKPKLPKKFSTYRHIIIVGIVLQVCFFSCVYYGIEKGVSAGLMALIASMQPIIVGVLSPFFTEEKISMRQWLGLILGLLGSGIVIGMNKNITYEELFGLSLAIGALLAMSFIPLFEKKSKENYDLILANLIQVLIGFIVLTPFAYFYEEYTFIFGMDLVVALFYLVFGNSFIAVILLVIMIREGESIKVSSLFYLIPPIAAVISYFVLDEIMSHGSIIGLFITMIGVALVRK